jgi:predicted nucleic acid-binding protein
VILVDTSVWVDFFRGTDRAADLAEHLESNLVLLHPWVLGELVLGGLGPRRKTVIADLKRLPASPLIPDEEVLELILTRQLSGRGIGWVDVHLLASALVAGCGLWTFDGRLGAVARDLGVVSVHGQPLQ